MAGKEFVLLLPDVVNGGFAREPGLRKLLCELLLDKLDLPVLSGLVSLECHC